MLEPPRQSVADRGEGAPAVEPAGRHNGAEIGVELGPPFRPETVRNFSENNRWPELPLGSVIGRRDVTAPHEDEQLVAGIDDNGISQMATVVVAGLQLKRAVELALKFARVGLHRAIGEIGRRPPISQAR